MSENIDYRPFPHAAEQAPWRDYVAKNAKYSTGAAVFQLMLRAGLEQEHTLVDVGCGSLRVGRFLITYLNAGNYVGVEPNTWLVEAAKEHEIGTLSDVKQAEFYTFDDFDLSHLERKFDWVMIANVLVHASHGQIEQAIRTSKAVLNPGGRFIGDFYPVGPDYTGDDFRYPDIATHTESCIQKLKGDFNYTNLGDDGFGNKFYMLTQ